MIAIVYCVTLHFIVKILITNNLVTNNLSCLSEHQFHQKSSTMKSVAEECEPPSEETETSLNANASTEIGEIHLEENHKKETPHDTHKDIMKHYREENECQDQHSEGNIYANTGTSRTEVTCPTEVTTKPPKPCKVNFI